MDPKNCRRTEGGEGDMTTGKDGSDQTCVYDPLVPPSETWLGLSLMLWPRPTLASAAALISTWTLRATLSSA